MAVRLLVRLLSHVRSDLEAQVRGWWRAVRRDLKHRWSRRPRAWRASAMALSAQDAVQAGRFHVEHPTLLNLGFEWAIEGDANRNATVEVRFRKVGAAWRSAPRAREGRRPRPDSPPGGV